MQSRSSSLPSNKLLLLVARRSGNFKPRSHCAGVVKSEVIPHRMDFLKGLNSAQHEAVTHVEGPLLILAGAGSGKTRVITHRVAHIIATHRAPPSAVLAVTFTNKAAGEMRGRVAALLADLDLSPSPQISTFHSFCVRLLRRDGGPLAATRPGFSRGFTIYDDDDQLAVVKTVYRYLGLDEKFMTCRAVLSAISHAKNLKQTPQDLYNQATDPTRSKVAVIYQEYENALRSANALDFDDLLLEAVCLLQHDDATRERYNHRLSHIMIDEYQDTNRSQYELMRLLSQSHRNVCVVGDEDQSIYSWRGADIRNILDFEHDYPNARVIRLEQNYRSTRNILEAASALVANNKKRKGKWLWTAADAGEQIGYYGGFDGENEALFIADTIERILASHPEEHVAVLYRTNFQSRQIEEALRRYGRNYQVVAGFSFYQRAEIRDLMAYLKLAVSPRDPISLLRIINTPARGIGKTSMEQAECYAREHGLRLWDAIVQLIEMQQFPTRAQTAMTAFRNMMEEISRAVATLPLHDAMDFIAKRTGYRRMLEEEDTPEAEGRRENINELIIAAREAVERRDGVAEFLDHAALVSEADSVDQRTQVLLLTLHNAKGLEFPFVFIAGMEDGLFPLNRSKSEEMLEEERRLCYVGMTRAEKRLILTWARSRRRFGGGELQGSSPSRFLEEIPEKLMVNLGAEETIPQVDLTAERHYARQSIRRNSFSGKTYNSFENIAQFFSERGMSFPAPASTPKPLPVAPKKAGSVQTTVRHPKYGTGTVIRREGEGTEAKITVNFPGYGLKKLVEKYANLKRDQ